jgi:hypothetical protein
LAVWVLLGASYRLSRRYRLIHRPLAMLRSPFLLLFVVTVLLALFGSACAPRPVMQPHVARAALAPAEASAMQQSCAGELCFPYEADTR